MGMSLKRMLIVILCMSLIMGESVVNGYASETYISQQEVIKRLEENEIIEENSGDDGEDILVDVSEMGEKEISIEKTEENSLEENEILFDEDETLSDENGTILDESEEIIFEDEFCGDDLCEDDYVYEEMLMGYNSDYRHWCQGNTAKGKFFVSAGCRVVASAMVLREMGFTEHLGNPDEFYDYCLSKGRLKWSDTYSAYIGENGDYGNFITAYLADYGYKCKVTKYTTVDHTKMYEILRDNPSAYIQAQANENGGMHTVCIGKNESIKNGYATMYDPGDGQIKLSTVKVGSKKSVLTNYRVFTVEGLVSQVTKPQIEYAAPVFESVFTDNYDYVKGTYRVNAIIKSEAGLDRVQYPTWTSANGQDDLAANWQSNYSVRGSLISLGNNTYSSSYTVKMGDHKGERGWYVTHVYAFDKAGKQSSYGINANLDKPKGSVNAISSEVKNIDYRNKKYTVTVNFKSTNPIARVQFPTWTTANGQDDLAAYWTTNESISGIVSSLGNSMYTASFTIDANRHNGERGAYITDIYAYDIYGYEYSLGRQNANLDVPYAMPKLLKYWTDKLEYNDGYYVVKIEFESEGGVNRVKIPSWTAYNGQDDLGTWWADDNNYRGTLEYLGGIKYRATYRVNISDHNNERGIYYSHAYVYDSYDRQICLGSITADMSYVELEGIHFISDVLYFKSGLAYDLNEYIEFEPYNASERGVTWGSNDFPFITGRNGHMYALEEKEGLVVVNSTTSNSYAIVKVVVDDFSDQYKDGLWIAELGEYGYTGDKITPEPVVYDGKKRLKKGVDYTVSYKNNIDANDASIEKKAPTVIVTGKGNYSGVEKERFVIKAVDISELDYKSMAVKCNGKKQKPIPTIYWKGKKLDSSNFSCRYYDSDNIEITAVKDAGEYRVEAIGKGNFKGSINIPLTVTSECKLISKMTVSSISDQKYTGNVICPSVVVKDGKKKLVYGIDYYINYKDNIDVGKATIVLFGIGDYTGEKRVSFNITGMPISKALIEGIHNMTYSGEELKLEDIGVYLKTTNTSPAIYLREDSDYTISYKNNVEVGTATVKITGINKYTGSIKKTFKILPFDLDDGADARIRIDYASTYSYRKGGAKPSFYLYYFKPNGQYVDLYEGVDYTISCTNHKKVCDDAVARIVFKKNFKGFFDLHYRIQPQDLANVKVEAKDKSYTAKAGNYKSSVVVTDVNGKKLTVNEDYNTKIEYTYADGRGIGANEIVPAGSVIKATVYAKEGSNYVGLKSCTYNIRKALLSSTKVTAKSQVYTGEKIEIPIYEIKVKTEKGTLVPGVDYIIEPNSYKNNVKKGTASVKIRGMGNYGGTKTVNFTIKAKGFKWWWR